MTLKMYHQKRQFAHTPEPRGSHQRADSALWFVVQKHDASRLHYDFRLELDGVLKSWAVPKGPSLNPKDKRLAVMVEDHPLEYRTFEGNIPKGNYGAGAVMVWDEGNYCSRETADRQESERLLLAGLAKGHLTFILNGQKLQGEFALVRLKRGKENEWLLLKKNDPWASDTDVTQNDRSASSGRTLDEIARDIKKPRRARTSKPESSKKSAKKATPTSQPAKKSTPPPQPTLTNLSKVYWPEEGYTKGDLLAYYREVAPVILPYLRDRPMSMLRHPNGITGKSFFQKDVSRQPPPPWIETTTVSSSSEKGKITYLLCQDEASLLYVANLGCIELNPWHSRVGSLDRPDYLVIDLDPENIDFPRVVEAAIAVRKVLDRAGAESVCKTSGKRGLHIYAPLDAQYDNDHALQFAQIIATLVHKGLPNTTSLVRSLAMRQGRVYLDCLQNRRSQTLAAAYSVRPYAGATVSTPLHWRELKKMSAAAAV